MRTVILRFLFAASPHMVEVVTTEDDAKRIIESWRTDRATYLFGYDREGKRHYAIRSSSIGAAFTIDLEELKKTQEDAKKQTLAGQPSLPPNVGGAGWGFSQQAT